MLALVALFAVDAVGAREGPGARRFGGGAPRTAGFAASKQAQQQRAMQRQSQQQAERQAQQQAAQRAAEAPAAPLRNEGAFEAPQDRARPGRLTPDERRALRQQINDAGRDLYRPGRP